jgi:hypothetical protein
MEKRNGYWIFVGTLGGKRPLGRSRHRRMDNTKMNILEIEWDSMGWIHLVRDKYHCTILVNTALDLRVAHNFEKFLTGCATGRTQLYKVSFMRSGF